MIVTKEIDLPLLASELAAAGVPTNGLGIAPTDTAGETELFTYTEDGAVTDLPPEAETVVAAHDGKKQSKAATFEAAEDAERLRLVNERARTDPAYAALAEMTLRGVQR